MAVGFPICTILAIFAQKVIPVLPTKFPVRWPRQSSWISDQNDFSYFDPQVALILPTEFQAKWAFGSGEKVQNDFQNGDQGSHLGFMIGTILSIFAQQAYPLLPIKFPVNWHFD